MPNAIFPPTLRKAIQSTKRRRQDAGYRQSDPASGPPYFEAFSDDVPAFWSFNLMFNRRDALFFWVWLKSQAENGRKSFMMPIATEYDAVSGIQDQLVNFTAGGFPQLIKEERDVLTYSCEVVGRTIASTSTDLALYNQLLAEQPSE